MNKLITKEEFKNIAHEVCDVNHNLVRWAKYPFVCGYNELGKQSLNMIATFLLLQQAKEQGIKIDETKVPLIALKRLIEKTINGDIRDDHIEQILEQGKIERKEFNILLNKKITNIQGLSNLLETINEDSTETKIYKIATKMATLVEVKEFSFISESTNTENEIYTKLTEYSDEFPQLVATAINLNGKEFLFLKEVSKLRGAIRWLKQFRATNCSVLEHLGETAIFAWLMSLEQDPEDFEKATRLFWIALFHDIAERWTGDMASPIKDAVSGLRKATELFEEAMLDKYVYSVLPPYQVKALKTVMEESKNITVKGADYISATLECYRNIVSGSRDEYFVKVVKNYIQNADDERFTPLAKGLIQEIWTKISKL